MLHLLVAVLDPAADATAVGVVRALRAVMPSLEVSRLGGASLAGEDVRDIARTGSLEAALTRTPVDAALLVGGGRWEQARLGRRLRRQRVTVAAMPGTDGIQWPWAGARLAAACDLVIASPVDDVDDLVAAGARVQRVSHPLADDVTLPLAADRAPPRRALGLTEDHSVVAVCATAGAAPLRALVPLVRDAVRQVQAAGEPLQVAIGAADPTEATAIRRLFGAVPGEAMQVGSARTSVTAADVVICGDGETTLLAALLGTPALLARRRPWRERVARMAAPRLGGRLVPFEAWANRVAADAVVPELLDEACQAPRVAEEIVALLGHAADQARRLADVRAAVRAERAWASIARLLIDMAVGRAGAAPDQPPTVNRNS